MSWDTIHEEQLVKMRFWVLCLLLASYSISYIDCSDESDNSAKDGEDDQSEDVIVVHDSWEAADLPDYEEIIEGLQDGEELAEAAETVEFVDGVPVIKPRETVQFTLDDAVPGPASSTTDSPPVVEDEVTRRAREQFEDAEAVLKSGAADKRAAWDAIEQSALANYSPAVLRLAWAYLLGNRFAINPAAAHTLFSSLAETGDPEAQMGMAFLYATGTVVNSSQSQALLYYTFGGFGGSPWAQMALGYRYWSGMGVATSCEKALDYYRRVAQSVAAEVTFSGGGSIQRVRLQDELDSGGQNNGLLDNDLIEYYQLLADKGDVQAQVGLGQLHYQGGRGVNMDHANALHYFQQAADAGNAIAMAFLGKMYLEGGEAVAQSNDTALKYFKKAAALGNPVGQSGLGLMYLYGKGVDKDYKKAFEYFQKAVEQNWVDGQLHLGNMYYNGWGVRKDFKMATKYFNLASQSGNVLAFFNLAEMHATGTGTLRSCPTAVELYKNVAERGKWGDKLMEAHTDYKRGR